MPCAGRVALRAALSMGALLTLVALCAPELVSRLLPLLRAALAWVASDFRLLGLDLLREGPDTSLRATAMLEHVIVLGQRAIVPDQRGGFIVTTAVGTVLQPPVLALALALAWPAGARELALRLAACSLLLVPLLLADAPLYLAGSLWDMQLRAARSTEMSLLVGWMHFLAGGGRLALGLAAGAFAIALAAPAPVRGRQDGSA